MFQKSTQNLKTEFEFDFLLIFFLEKIFETKN